MKLTNHNKEQIRETIERLKTESSVWCLDIEEDAVCRVQSIFNRLGLTISQTIEAYPPLERKTFDLLIKQQGENS